MISLDQSEGFWRSWGLLRLCLQRLGAHWFGYHWVGGYAKTSLASAFLLGLPSGDFKPALEGFFGAHLGGG